VARSADAGRLRLRRRLLATATALLAVPLAGCTTTQHEAQREQLDSARLRAALAGTHVQVPGSLVRPTGIATVSNGRQTGFIVTVRDDTRRALADLPISVGYRTSTGRRVYLNSSAGLHYFQAHRPVVGAGKTLIWVYTTARAMPSGARPFALVGDRPSPPALLTETNVRIAVEYKYGSDSRSVTVHLQNPTSVPQYQLQVYAHVRDGARYVAAGNMTVAELGAGSKQTVTLPLVGQAGAGALEVTAIPTILQ
jgi:hypothetical protein